MMLTQGDIQFMKDSVREVVENWNTTITLMSPLPLDKQPNYNQYLREFNGDVGGLGFLALAALIFGQWNPFGILGATFFFGFASTIANVSQVIPELASFPPVILKTFPYVMTLIALIIFSKSSRAPKAVGEIFDKGKR